MRFLLVSNGHGEDVIGALLARELRRQRPGVQVTALPLVGEGRAYDEAGIPCLGPRWVAPSGGFSGRSPRFLWQDLRAGLIGAIRAQVRTLRAERAREPVLIVVGDTYNLAMCLFAGGFRGRPTLFLPTAKSEYSMPHLGVEIALMRRFTRAVFPRDAHTAAVLAAAGVRARYVGNLMLDALAPQGLLPLPPGVRAVGILPGSRAEARENLALLLAAAQELAARGRTAGEEYIFCVALASTLTEETVTAAVSFTGGDWHWDPASTVPGALGELRDGTGTRVLVSRAFSDVLLRAELVFGMAGTGNEQAVGLGRPVVTTVGTGPQFNAGFVREQGRLLGEAVAIVPRDPAALAETAWEILHDPARREHMAAVGRERMGEPGGARRLVEIIYSRAEKGFWL